MKTVKTLSNSTSKEPISGKTFENKNIHTTAKKEHSKGYTNGIVPHVNANDMNRHSK